MNVKKILAIVICICVYFTNETMCIPLSTWAADEQNITSGTCGDNTTWVFDETTGILTFGGNGVVKSRNGWSKFHDSIKGIYIGKEIIGFNIELHGSYYGEDTSLQNVEYFEVENGNVYFNTVDGVLFNSDKTELIYYPAGRIGPYVIPDGVIRIGDKAFRACNQLTAVSITNSVEVVGKEAFYPCLNLSSVEIGTGVKVIESHAFWCTQKLASITIPENVESIGYQAFADSGWSDDFKGLQSVTILGKNTKMLDAGSYAETFANCRDLKQVNIACDIGGYAFKNCGELADVTIMEGAEEIGYAAFSGCNNIENIELPKSLKKISNDVFNSDRIKEFYIPANLEEMQGAAVRFCNNLTNFIIDEKNNNFKIKDGILFDSSLTTIIKYPQQKKDISEYEIPTGVSSISNSAFYGCSALTDIIIPKGIKKIDRYAFASCSSLKKLVIPEGVQALRGPMISGSNSLEYIAIPQSVIDIGSWKMSTHILGGVDFDLDVYCYSTETFSDYTEYKRLDNGVNIIYDANGGSCNNNGQVVYPTKPYENMPVPEREGFTFVGWYTQRDGGRKITDYSIVDQITDYTLYAHWEDTQDAEKKIEVDDLSYSFGNHYQAFGYKPGYRIPLKIFQNIWGDSITAKYLYNNQAPWGGNCYGMATTSGMFNTKDSGVAVQKFSSNADKVRDLKIQDVNSDWGMNVREFIETLFVSQYDLPIQNGYQDNKGKLSELCNMVKNEELVLIAVFGSQGGHALLGYRLEDIDATTAKLYVYDCNFPLQERYITLTKNASGEYTKWYYYLNDLYDWGTGYKNSWISYIPYETYASEWHNSMKQRDSVMNMLYVNASNFIIEDVDGDEVARIVDNDLKTDRTDIIQIRDTGMTSDAQTMQMPNIIYLPADIYTVKNVDSNVNDLNICFVDNNFGVQVTTASDEVTIMANDIDENGSVFISSDAGDTYHIQLDTSFDNVYNTIRLEGESTGEIVGIELSDGLVSLTNSSKENMFVEIDGNNTKYYTLNAEAEQGGIISPSGTYYAMPGASVKFTINPENGYKLKDVLVDDSSIGALNQYELGKISEDHKILAKFSPKDVLVENINLNVTNTSVQEKSTLKLEAVIVPENATNKELKWSSENSKVAVVDNMGLVTAVGIGQTTITAEATDGSGKKASCIVKVRSLGNQNDFPAWNIPGNSGSGAGGNNSSGNSESSENPGGQMQVSVLYYIVTFDANGGSKLSRKNMTLLQDDNLGILPKVQYENYSFKGWYTEKFDGVKVSGSTVLNTATTLYAHWEKTAKPAKIKISALKSSKVGQIVVRFQKQPGVDGYVIAYSTNKKFPLSSTKEIVLSSANRKINKLKSGKKYYIRVRAYNVDSTGKKVYGSYSTIKSIKVK